MKLSSDQIKKVRKLANLQITNQEIAKYSDQLSKILDYIDQLNKVDTEDINPTFNITGLENIMREDKVEESLSQKETLKNAPQSHDGLFVTKGIFSEN